MTQSCGDLTRKARGGSCLRVVERDSDLWQFVRSWVRRIQRPAAGRTEAGAEFERFIFLWMSVNAWASLAVPDTTRNHQDVYLVHAMAADNGMTQWFSEALENDVFRAWVDDLAELSPVFKVLWLRNQGIDSWNPASETRKDFVARVMASQPFEVRRGGEEVPAFAPLCAKTHLDAGEPIPRDWPHTLSMIYQVRCNLFHGGKTYSSQRDTRFVELAFNILWRVWRRALPFDWGGRSWRQLFIRSGFRFSGVDGDYDFSDEAPANCRFLDRLLGELGFGSFLAGRRFRVPRELVTEHEWFSAWERLQGRAEAGPRGFDRIELENMDAHIAGVVRWLNSLGFETTISCEGHGREAPTIRLAIGRDASAVSDLIAETSGTRILFRDGRLLPRAEGSERMVRREALLELAERLHQRYADAARRPSASPG